MSKETQHTVVLELGAGGGPGAGPGVVAVDLDGLTIRENVSQIACPYRRSRLEFGDLEAAIEGLQGSVFLRSRSGEALRAVGFQAPEVARCFVRLVNVGIAAHDSDSDPHGILSADAPAGVRKALEEERERERKEARARLEASLEEAREAFGVEPVVPVQKAERYKPGPSARPVEVGSSEELEQALDDFVRRHAPRGRSLCFSLSGGGYVELGHGPDGYYLRGPEGTGRPSTPREARELLRDAAEGVVVGDSLRKKLEEAAPVV